MGTGLEIALIATALVGTGASIDASKQSARRQKRATEINSNIQQGTEREKTQQTLREKNIRKARILASAENTGTTGSSGLIGAIGGLETRTESNAAFNRSQTLANIEIGNLNQQAADASTRANTAGAVAGLALTAANFAAGSAKPNTPAPSSNT